MKNLETHQSVLTAHLQRKTYRKLCKKVLACSPFHASCDENALIPEKI